MPPLAALPIADTPVAILDFETTGLRPGPDRVIEVAVVRIDPGQPPRLVLDTLVNPRRPVACTEIHGITDDDVADAPEFADIAPALRAALAGCAMAAYNVYFDLKFLEYELNRAGTRGTPPHLCLMYLRPMLGLGSRCSLDDACREHGIRQRASHLAAADVLAEGELYRFYQTVCREMELNTFGDLAQLRSYKFCDSFELEPLLFEVPERAPRLKSRRLESRPNPVPGWSSTPKTPPLTKGGWGGERLATRIVITRQTVVRSCSRTSVSRSEPPPTPLAVAAERRSTPRITFAPDSSLQPPAERRKNRLSTSRSPRPREQ